MLRIRLIALWALLVLIPAAPASAAVKPGWGPAASLDQPRYAHSAVLLDDGRVLVAGGYDWPEPLRGAELYDPASDRWTATGSLHRGRMQAAMVKLADGRVLIAGGTAGDGSPTGGAEVYDPRTGAWTPTKPVVTPRLAPASILLPNGKVLLAGGLQPDHQYANTAEVYDPGTNEWFPAGEFADAVGGFPAAALLPDGRAIVSGGNGAQGAVATTRRYNGGISWTTLAPMRTPRYEHALSTLPDGRLTAAGGMTYFGSGGTVELYDPRTDAWVPRTPTRGLFEPDRATALGRGLTLVTGRERVDAADPVVLPSAQVYDPTTDAWSVTGTPTARTYGFTTTLLADGRVLLAGGMDDTTNPVRLVELWTPTSALATEPAVAFGDATVGTGVSGVVQVTNTGPLALLVGDLAVHGAHPGDFSVDGGRCRFAIAPGTTCALDVRFTPSAAGVRGATLTIGANTSAGSHVVPLGGRGVAPAPAPTVPVDGDGDGVPDAVDRCPTLKGTAVRSGCPAGLLADPSIAYRRVKGGIKVVAYYVKATTGARVVVKCSKGCRTTTTRGKGAKRIRITRLNGRRLGNGTKITVTVSLAGRLTTTVTDSIARGRRVEGRPVCAPVGC